MIDIDQLNRIENMALNGEAWIAEIDNLLPNQWVKFIENTYQVQYFDAPNIQVIEGYINPQHMHKYGVLAVESLGQKYFIIPSPWHSNLISLVQKEQSLFKLVFADLTYIQHHLQFVQNFAHDDFNRETTHNNNHGVNNDDSYNTKDSNNTVELLTLESIAKSDNEVIQIVNATLYDAYNKKASDIHFENFSGGLNIRYRLDGILVTIKKIHKSDIVQQMISRLKVLADLDIGERRIPQDGRFTVDLKHKLLDFRVSVMPGVFGEDVVLRILDKEGLLKSGQRLTLNDLGFASDFQQQLHQIANQPYGMVLLTGPTGSGKTTTVYALINETLKPYEKLITVEDPVEYALDNALQIPINEKKGLTFAKGLRSILRHDPDKILVGEIRDKETGEIAIQAALTGHLVFTTVHANNVFDVIGRFQHMQIDQFNLVSALNGIVAQRLIRTLCTKCKALDQASQYYQAVGCGDCNHTGFKGRIAIAEILKLDDQLKELIIQKASIAQIKSLSLQHGIQPMRSIALKLLEQGETTLEEVNRVTFQEI